MQLWNMLGSPDNYVPKVNKSTRLSQEDNTNSRRGCRRKKASTNERSRRLEFHHLDTRGGVPL